MVWCSNCNTNCNTNCNDNNNNNNNKCPSCGEFLVNDPQHLNKCDDFISPDVQDVQSAHDIPEVQFDPCLLVKINDGVTAALIRNMLSENDIPCSNIDRGPRTYNKIFMGSSIFDTEIYVNKMDYDRAKEIVDGYFAKPENLVEFEPLKDSDNRLFFAGKTIMRIFIGIAILTFAFFLILSAISLIKN